MFEKLLANLPYNPGLTKQIGFYVRRMKREEAIRRTGLVFIVLAFMVQFFAFISPPQQTTAYSSSDMVNGGISSKEDAVRACKQNVKNYGDALWNFGVSCKDIANSHVTSVRSTDFDNRLFSLSWLPYGQTNPNSGKPTDETAYNLAKVAETIYARRLISADTIPFSTYQVLKGTTSDGKTFFIMFGCGNLMVIGVPHPIKMCEFNHDLYANDNNCFKPCEFDKSIPASSKKCFEPCPIKGLKDIPKSSPKCVAPCPYNKDISSNSPKCFPPCKYNASISADSPKCFQPCPYNNDIPKTSDKCKPCKDASSTENALACIVQRKSASNTTRGLSNADGTTAQPNDVIVYTLFAENKGKAAVKNFVMQENLSDVLDYANVVNLHGGKKGANNMISWPSATVNAGSTLTHKITVRVKNPLPKDAPNATDPNHFDRIMTNVYGNAVNINVPLPTPVIPGSTSTTPGSTAVTAAAASASESLPKTGPGTGLALAGVIVVIAGYFFARSRLLVDESMLVIQETNSGTL